MTSTPVSQRKFYIAKHDLQSLHLLPECLWRTDKGPHEKPSIARIAVGDRWISFAYTSSDNQEHRSSHITGFFECVEPASFGDLPIEGEGKGWLVKGERYGEQHLEEVRVPPITELLKKQVFQGQTLTSISEAEYEGIRRFTLERCITPSKIPLLMREPRNEQEVLTVTTAVLSSLGIQRIKHIQTAFPDLLVELNGGMELHLELEMWSSGYFAHGHNLAVECGRFKGDDKPVAILCWIHDDKTVESHVPVFVLPDLLRCNECIIWNTTHTTKTPPLS